MKLVRYHYPLADGLNELDRWFRSPSEGFGRLLDLAERLGGVPSAAAPGFGVELYEDDDNYHARLEMPGVKKEHLKVELHDHQLSVSAERAGAPSQEGGVQQRSEVRRSVTVPEGIDEGRVSAKLEDGILTVTLPKAPDRKPREIQVS